MGAIALQTEGEMGRHFGVQGMTKGEIDELLVAEGECGVRRRAVERGRRPK